MRFYGAGINELSAAMPESSVFEGIVSLFVSFSSVAHRICLFFVFVPELSGEVIISILVYRMVWLLSGLTLSGNFD